ncbi:MAG: TadG family pilus assembly protein [Achromobacter sp.]|uniref:TadG family pilus assembly protein n=1 Tax=Achromobacter sp. TaxID=134375 RepID=UPI003D064C9E
MPASFPPPVPLPRQRGSVTVAVVFAVLVGLVLLGAAQLAYSFYMKREMQKGADLAALSAVQVLGMGSAADCARAVTAGRVSALRNIPDLVDTFEDADIAVECKVWDSGRTDASGMHVFDAGAGEAFNAVRVTVRKQLSSIIPRFGSGESGSAMVSTTAVAANTKPVAAFSVGSRLLRLERGGLLSRLLATVGASPAQLDVLDAAGLARVDITPAGLLRALGLPLSVASGLGTPEQLAAIENLTLGQLLNATLSVLDDMGTASADLGLLTNAIHTALEVMPLDLPVKLFGDGGVLDLSVEGAGAHSALQATVNARNVLETALVVANGENLIDLGLNVPLLGIDAQVRVVEPPTVAIGGVGTQAASAGIRVYLRVTTANIPLVGPLLASTLNTVVDLPIIIDVGQSTGTLTKLCAAPLTQEQATIDVTSSVASVCLGRFPGMESATDKAPAHFLSLTNRCEPGAFDTVQPYQVLNVLGILPLNSRATFAAFESPAPVPVTLTEPPSPQAFATVNASSVDLAGLASNLSDALVAGILGDLASSGTPLTDEQRKALAKDLVGGGGSDPGKSVSEVFQNLKWSKTAMDQLGQRMATGGLTGVLGGTLEVVGNALTTLLVAPVNDLLCGVGGIFGPGATRQCRIDSVAALALNDGGQLGGVLSIVISLLSPLLDMLSGMLQQLLDLLGLSLGQTDVSLISVDCGRPRLVY